MSLSPAAFDRLPLEEQLRLIAFDRERTAIEQAAAS